MSDLLLEKLKRRDLRISEHRIALKEADERIAELELIIRAAYIGGYSDGHNDTVESNFADPEDYPEEWAEIRHNIEANLRTEEDNQHG